MKHILSNCPMALDRYHWRHNEVLKIILRITSERLEAINKGQKPQTRANNNIPFVRPGQKSQYKRKTTTRNDEQWDGTWKVSADLAGHERLFPIVTSKRPDMVVWCEERKIVHLVELTCPHEDNVDAAQVRKDERYEALVRECNEDAGWRATHFPVEVGCRGYIGGRLVKWFNFIGVGCRQKNTVVKEIQHTVEKASHWIWLKRNDESWHE